jgi:hypothetical protein
MIYDKFDAIVRHAFASKIIHGFDYADRKMSDLRRTGKI